MGAVGSLVDGAVGLVVNAADVGESAPAPRRPDAVVGVRGPEGALHVTSAAVRSIRDVDAIGRDITQLNARLEAGEAPLRANITTGIVDLAEDVVGAPRRLVDDVIALAVGAVQRRSKANRG